MTYYSQFSEDRFLHEAALSPAKGVFVDVGAYDGVSCSNTKFFEDHGWEGICIEPDPEIAALCRKNRKAFTFACAIGAGEVESDFLRINLADRGTSGLSRPETGNNLMVPVVKMSRLLELWGPPHIDLMSIDTEGTEAEVIDGLGMWRPDILIAEFWTQPQPPRLEEIQKSAYRLGYREIHRTEANLIFTIH